MGHCTWWTKRWWVPQQEVNKVTQQKKQNANTIERVLKICIVSPAPVGMTARKWHLQLHRTNQKKTCNQWDFPQISGFHQISINFLNSQHNFGTRGNGSVGWIKDFKAPHHGRHEDWLFGNLPDRPTVPLEVWNPMKTYDLHLKIGEKTGPAIGSDLTTRWS